MSSYISSGELFSDATWNMLSKTSECWDRKMRWTRNNWRDVGDALAESKVSPFEKYSVGCGSVSIVRNTAQTVAVAEGEERTYRAMWDPELCETPNLAWRYASS